MSSEMLEILETTADKYDEAYRMAREIAAGQMISWDLACRRIFSIDIPDQGDSERWAYHVQMRNRFKDAINKRCAAYGENWRLYVTQSPLGDLIKEEARAMVKHETAMRMKKAAQAFGLFQKRLEPMLSSEGLTKKDRRMIRQMVTVGHASAMAMAGQIQSMDSFNKQEKLEYTSLLLRFSETDKYEEETE